jgi:hypothetical protein
VVDDTDPRFQGNCVAVGDLCHDPDGDGVGTCALRPDEGEACRAVPVAGSQQGSCGATYLFCRRDSPTAASGICTRVPRRGEACGDRHDLSRTCADLESAVMLSVIWCSTSELDEAGVCESYPGDPQPGDLCEDSSGCPRAHYCEQSSGSCQPGADLGSSCADTDQVCGEGYCWAVAEDAGDQYLCLPFLELGAACSSAGGDVACGPEAHCAEQAGAGYVCVARVGAGEACGGDVECAAGLRCAEGICVAGRCARDGCGCNDLSSLTSLLFFALVLGGAPLRRRRA